MKIDRAAMLKACEICKPALASKELIEELCHFWLDGELLTAFNDATLGIQVPFKCELQGGIRGSVLHGFLTHTRAETVEVELPADGEALIKAGRSRLKLSLLPPDRAVYELPKLDKTKGYRLSSEFLAALRRVMVSIGNATAIPEQLGVTIMLQGGLQFYATDDATVAWATVKNTQDWPLKPGKRVTLPTPFIEQLLKLADDKATFMFLTPDSVVAITGDKVKLFAKLVEVPKPNDFGQILAEAIKEAQLFDTPARIKLALQRAEIILVNEAEPVVSLKLEENVLRIYATSGIGDLKDSMVIAEPPANADVAIRVNPEFIKRALDLTATISLKEYNTLMMGKDFAYLISNFVK